VDAVSIEAKSVRCSDILSILVKEEITEKCTCASCLTGCENRRESFLSQRNLIDRIKRCDEAVDYGKAPSHQHRAMETFAMSDKLVSDHSGANAASLCCPHSLAQLDVLGLLELCTASGAHREMVPGCQGQGEVGRC